jgi:hypothetical protein
MTRNKNTSIFIGIALLFGVLCGSLCREARATVTLYPAPSGAPVDTVYTVTVNGSPVPVYSFFKQHVYNWTTTSEMRFAQWDTDQSVTVTVTVPAGFSSYTVRPWSKNIAASQSGNTLSFTIPAGIRQLCVEFNGDAKHPLMLFTNPPQPAIGPNTPNTIYYGPGIYNVGDLTWLDSSLGYDGWTVYIAGGAIVEGDIAIYANNFTIRGSGILYDPAGGSSSPLQLNNPGATIQDIVLCNSANQWTCQVKGIASGTTNFNNLKILSEVRDGLDICDSSNVTVNNSYIMAFDDSIALKGMSYGGSAGDSNITVENSTVSHMGGGNSEEIGWEMDGGAISNVLYNNIDNIHSLWNGNVWPQSCISMHPNGLGAVSNINYANLRIEDSEAQSLFGFIYPGGAASGINGVTVNNVRVVGGPSQPSNLDGQSSTSMIQNVSFNDLYFKGTGIASATQGNFNLNQYTSGITFGLSSVNKGAASGQCATPTFSVPGGNYSTSQTVNISDRTPGSVIYYTVDGTTPNTASAHGTSVTISRNVALKAFAVANGVTNSNLGSAFYCVNMSNSPTSAPPAPAGLTATPGNAAVTLGWPASSGATSYNLWRGTASGGETQVGWYLMSTSLTDVGDAEIPTVLSNGTVYYYKVQAVNSAGTSGFSPEVSAIPSVGLANGTYVLTPSCATGQSLDAYAFGTLNGSNVEIWATNGATNQEWVFTNEGGNVYKIQPSYDTSLCLDVIGAGGSGTNCDLYADNGTNAQRWAVIKGSDGTYTLVPQCATACALDVWQAGSANDTQVDVYAANGTNAQKWTITSP